MTQIVELKGTEKRLYQLVAPLVMNPVVLKQNYNYPFRTSENFIWFVAVEGKEIVGFILSLFFFYLILSALFYVGM